MPDMRLLIQLSRLGKCFISAVKHNRKANGNTPNRSPIIALHTKQLEKRMHVSLI